MGVYFLVILLIAAPKKWHVLEKNTCEFLFHDKYK